LINLIVVLSLEFDYERSHKHERDARTSLVIRPFYR